MQSTSRKSVKRSVENCIVVKEMSGTRPVRCQKYGKPLGCVTVLAKGLTLSHPLQDMKIIAIRMECAHSKKNSIQKTLKRPSAIAFLKILMLGILYAGIAYRRKDASPSKR